MKTLFKNKLFISLFALFMTVCALLGIMATFPRSAKADTYYMDEKDCKESLYWDAWSLYEFKDWEETNYTGQTAINRWFKVDVTNAVDADHASKCPCAGSDTGLMFSIQLTSHTKLVVEVCKAAPMRYSLESDGVLTGVVIKKNGDFDAGFEMDEYPAGPFAFKVPLISFEEPDGTTYSTETHALDIASAVSATGTAVELVEIIDPGAEPIVDVWPEETPKEEPTEKDNEDNSNNFGKVFSLVLGIVIILGGVIGLSSLLIKKRKK